MKFYRLSFCRKWLHQTENDWKFYPRPYLLLRNPPLSMSASLYSHPFLQQLLSRLLQYLPHFERQLAKNARFVQFSQYALQAFLGLRGFDDIPHFQRDLRAISHTPNSLEFPFSLDLLSRLIHSLVLFSFLS